MFLFASPSEKLTQDHTQSSPCRNVLPADIVRADRMAPMDAHTAMGDAIRVMLIIKMVPAAIKDEPKWFLTVYIASGVWQGARQSHISLYKNPYPRYPRARIQLQEFSASEKYPHGVNFSIHAFYLFGKV